LWCGTGFATGDDNGKACVAVSLHTAESVLESGSVLGHQIADFVDVGLAERQIAQNPYVCNDTQSFEADCIQNSTE